MSGELLDKDKLNNVFEYRYIYGNYIVEPILKNKFTCYDCEFINTCRVGGSINGEFIIQRASERACGGLVYPLKIIE